VGLALLGLTLLYASTRVCLSTGFAYGLWLDRCPDGELRQTVSLNAPSLQRGAKAYVSVNAIAHYTTGDVYGLQQVALPRFTPSLTLVGGGKEWPLEPKEGWRENGGSMGAEVVLPSVNDGDYTLHAKVGSALGESTLDVAVPFYTPARVHVLTDRPLYQPGNTVKFRAVALKASDLTPLDGRPGTWVVSSPSAEVLLEEKAPAGDYGVVAGSFPLDSQAEHGDWHVSWRSGAVTETRAFTVKPFTLPRFRIDASSAKRFYRRHEHPKLLGTVTYASGAPVADAKVELAWSVSGSWPAPTGFEEAFPRVATTSAAGTFSVDLPEVPDDLQGQVHLIGRLSAVDHSGDRVEGLADVLLSEDAIAVSTVSEFAEGLVDGLNNRVYLRATSADGQVLHDVSLNVKRLWEPTDKGTDAKVDEDGVASLQLDPGPAVNVIIPAAPFRPPAKARPLTRNDLNDYLAPGGSNEVSLADRLVFDRAEAAMVGCTRYVTANETEAMMGVQVSPSGAVMGQSGPATRLGHCLSAILGGLHFAAGRARLFQGTWAFDDSDLPKLSAQLQGVPQVPDEVNQAFTDAMSDLRDCLPATVSSGQFPQMVLWQRAGHAHTVSLTWTPAPGAQALAEAAQHCITSRLTSLKLPKRRGEPTEEEDEAQQSSFGAATFSIEAPAKYEAVRPQPTVMLGYELLVTAKAGHETLGSTKLRLNPGRVPDLRLRANSQLVKQGEAVTVELLRGPDFQGELPEKAFFTYGTKVLEAKLDAEKHTAAFSVPDDAEGWASVVSGTAHLFLFAAPRNQLTVSVTPEKPRYAPGQLAQLQVETKIAGTGGSAAVGLFGVDDSLSQLAPLPQADELAGLRPQVSASGAFGGIDAQALALGRVRGANAAAATLLKVSALPPTAQVETPVSVSGQTVFDPNEALTDHFYAALSELHLKVRDWEEKAPAGEKLSNAKLASLWNGALDAVEARKESARDVWGRRLRLHRLPADLLVLTEPRQVIVDGTRLPEDMVNWSQWVAKEKP
jgi:hypothetical protein